LSPFATQKTCDKMEVQIRRLLTSSLDRDEWPGSGLGRFNIRGKKSPMLLHRRLGAARSSFRRFEEDTASCLYRESKRVSCVVHSATQSVFRKGLRWGIWWEFVYRDFFEREMKEGSGNRASRIKCY
jgi:hypothetical protein